MRGLCPRCGQGALFEGFLGIKPHCSACGLDFGFADSGDGPAFFVMSIVGCLAVLVAVIVRFGFGAPAGAALIASFLVTILATLATLRPAKGLLIGLQYKNNAHEGQRP